jgi:tRNA(fMet)-specific endonuclease VapC
MIGELDCLIAAQALALNLPLVTNNTDEFRRVAGLEIENWSDSP